LGWYRADADPDKPNSLGLWSNNFQGAYVITSTVSDNGSVGWQWTTLSSPIQIFAGQTYIVSEHVPNGVTLSFTGGSPALPAETTSLKSELPNAVGITNVNHVYPINSLGSTNLYWIDVEFETLSPDTVDPNTAGAILDQKLAAWFSTNDNTHTAELPYQTYLRAGDAETAAEAAQNAHATAQQVQTDLGQFRDEWPGTLATSLQAGLNTIAGWLNTEADWYRKLVHDTADPAAAFLDRLGTYTGVGLFDLLAELIRWSNGVYDRPQLADTDDWELLDETDFTDNLLWPVEADVYRVTLSAFDPAGTSETVGTETRHGYLGKWCPFNVQFSSEWHYFNTASADLYVGGRMPGLGLILYRPGAGHVQAWRRKEAP
jgi:hypothetical protein